jgi:hypothetical protein
MELMDMPRTLFGSTFTVPATLQGPLMKIFPGLHLVDDIPVEVEFYNEYKEVFFKGSVVLCFGTISFQEQQTSIPKLLVKAIRLNRYVAIDILCYSAFHSLTPFLQLPWRSDHRTIHQFSSRHDERFPGLCWSHSPTSPIDR